MPARTDAIGEFLATNLPPFAAWQEQYRAAKGRYAQFLSPVPALPPQGERLDPDYARTPTDCSVTLDDLGIAFPPDLPCLFTVDVYDGPAGMGWTVTVVVTDDDGVTYERCDAAGPEAGRAFGWRPLAGEGVANG